MDYFTPLSYPSATMMKALVLFQLILSTTALADSPMIDLERVSPTVKKRFLKIGANHFTTPDQFTLSCGETFNTEGYEFNHMAFEVNEPIQKVWDTYMNSNPKEAWNGKMIQFDFAYSKPNQTVYYHDDVSIPKPHVGMGFFIILDVYQLKKLPASLEISKIDQDEKIFEYTYLSQNTAHGRQSVKFTDLGNNKTRIVHDTHFKSDSRFRDKKLYPPIHEALLEEFHQNVMNQINAKAVRTE